jgi:hypothetical protein
MMMAVSSLAVLWRQEAGVLRKRGDVRGADLMIQVAEDLATAMREDGESLLSLSDAAIECGYPAPSLGRMVREGKLTNFGTKGAPRIRRGDLPRKPGLSHGELRLQFDPAPKERIARSIANRDGGRDGR